MSTEELFIIAVMIVNAALGGAIGWGARQAWAIRETSRDVAYWRNRALRLESDLVTANARAAVAWEYIDGAMKKPLAPEKEPG